MDEEILVEFTPPSGTVDESASEGEAMVRWQKKPDGRYCIVEFEGQPLSGYDDAKDSSEMTADEELDSLAQETNY